MWARDSAHPAQTGESGAVSGAFGDEMSMQNGSADDLDRGCAHDVASEEQGRVWDRQSSSTHVDKLRDGVEQTMEAVAYHLRNKYGTLRQAFSIMSSASKAKLVKEGRWTKQGRLVGVEGVASVASNDSVEERAVDEGSWAHMLRSLTALSLQTSDIVETFRLIDARGSGRIELADLEAALRTAARGRVERRGRIAWAAKEAKKAARRSQAEQQAQQLLAGAEAALVMRDPVLADRRIVHAREKFHEAYKGEEMLMDVEKELAQLQRRVDSLVPDRYGHSVPTPPRFDMSATLHTSAAGKASATRQLNGDVSSSLLNGSTTVIVPDHDSTLKLDSSRPSSVLGGTQKSNGGSKGKGVVYEAKAQLFRPTPGAASPDECTYVTAATLQVTSYTTRGSYGKETAQFKLSLLTATAPTSARADAMKVFDSHALDGHVKAEVSSSPFWLWLSWPQRSGCLALLASNLSVSWAPLANQGPLSEAAHAPAAADECWAAPSCCALASGLPSSATL